MADLPSTKVEIREGFERMYNDLKDPEKREEARRKAEVIKRNDDKRKDTGL